jgi:hypothetical protein
MNNDFKFKQLCDTASDINEHLPTLYKYATECESVIELGVRGCVSSWAFVCGLLNNGKSSRRLFLNDINACDIDELMHVTANLDIKINYEWVSDLHLQTDEMFDLTFIDTWHVYGQLKRELKKFSQITNKYIIMHDTTLDAIQGETIRSGWDAKQQSLATGIPVDEINCGLQKAIDEFLMENSNWTLHETFTNNNGLTVLKRV